MGWTLLLYGWQHGIMWLQLLLVWLKLFWGVNQRLDWVSLSTVLKLGGGGDGHVCGSGIGTFCRHAWYSYMGMESIVVGAVGSRYE